MRKIQILLLAFLIGGTFCFAAGQANQTPQTPQTPTQQPSTQPPSDAAQAGVGLTGIVEKVNMDKKVLTLRDEKSGAKKDLWFGEKTTFTNGAGSTATIQDVKPGSKVKVQVDEYNMITSIDITPGSNAVNPS